MATVDRLRDVRRPTRVMLYSAQGELIADDTFDAHTGQILAILDDYLDTYPDAVRVVVDVAL